MIGLLRWIIPLLLLLAISSHLWTAIIRMSGKRWYLSPPQKLANYFIERLLQRWSNWRIKRGLKFKSNLTKKVETFKVGDIVVLLDIRGKYPEANSNPGIGTIYECEGEITAIGYIPTSREEMALVPVSVHWTNGASNQYRLCDIEHLDTFLNKPNTRRAAEAKVTPFNPGDIVYIRPGVHGASREWPSIGSDYETDLKVIEVITSKFRSICKYNLFNPSTQTYCFARHSELVTPQEKLKYKTTLFYKPNKNIPGILNTDDLFFQLGEHLYNESETVILKVTPELLGIFTKTKL